MGYTSNLSGDVTVGYSTDDRITSQKQGATQTNYSYDALGRRYQDKQNTVVQVTRHYGDESDSPNWVTSGPVGAITQTDVFTPSLGSSLNITRTTKAGATTTYLNFANLHGDTITSLVVPTSGYVSAPIALNVFDEYGVNQPIDPASLQAGSTYADTRNLFVNNYGSLGQAQRETTDTGIQFMGARGYNPITGQFLTPDPVRGGNETTYNYPNEPINRTDVTGQMEWWQSLIATVVITAVAVALVAAICAATAGVGCLVSGLVINGIAGLTSGAIEADSRGLKGQERNNYMLESAAISSVSFGYGRVASRVIGETMVASRVAMRSWARNVKWFKSTLKIASSAVPSFAVKRMLKWSQNKMYDQMED
jgi:RHS repeat-associated protein